MSLGICIKNVSFAYEKDTPVLANISLEIYNGALLGITGVNGSGKTTLTYLLNGLIPHFVKGYFKGEVLVEGINTKTKSVAFFAKKVGLLFQNPDWSLFNLTVEEEIEFGLKNLKLGNRPQRIKRALSQVGLSDYLKRDPQTLSFGEKQKISLASILALDTDYIVLDEPTAMLDYKSALDLYKILLQLNLKKKTIIVVEHDTDFLWQFTKEVLILDKGRLKAFGNTKKILSNSKRLHSLGIKPPNKKFKLKNP